MKMKARDYFVFRFQEGITITNAMQLAEGFRRDAKNLKIEIDETDETLIAVIREEIIRVLETKYTTAKKERA